MVLWARVDASCGLFLRRPSLVGRQRGLQVLAEGLDVAFQHMADRFVRQVLLHRARQVQRFGGLLVGQRNGHQAAPRLQQPRVEFQRALQVARGAGPVLQRQAGIGQAQVGLGDFGCTTASRLKMVTACCMSLAAR
jgi:hypothetical protein